MGLGYEGIRYYAYAVIKAQITQISRRADEARYLHLIAFVVYQTFKLNDTLIDTLLLSVQAATNATEKALKEAYYQERGQRTQSFAALAGRLGQSVRETLSAIGRIVADPQLGDSEKVASINAALTAQDGKPNPVEQQIDEFKLHLAAVHLGRDGYAPLEEQSLKLQHRVADIVRQVRFAPNGGKPALGKALLHYQDQGGTLDKSAPVAFLSAEQRAALAGPDGKFRVSLYKALLYVKVAAAIKSGALNLVHSEKYRSLDDDLIREADWEAHRDEYLQRSRLEGFADCRATLKELGQALDTRYQETNQRFKAGDNPFLTLRASGTFHVSTPKLEDVECLSLGAFFPERKYISLLEMLATVDHATDFLGEFEHWQPKYQRARPPKKILFAGIIGYGCDIGHRKLAPISKQIDENALDNAVNWYFSLQNVQPLAPRYANDPGEYVSVGFNQWFKTWPVDFASLYDIFWKVSPEVSEIIDLNEIPPQASDSPMERQQLLAIFIAFNENHSLTPELDDRFAELARQRIAQHPVQYYVYLPVLRIANMWFRPRIEQINLEQHWWRFNPLKESLFSVGYAFLNALLVMTAILVMVKFRYAPGAGLLIGFIIIRSAFLGTMENPEPRYVLECFPVILAFAGAQAYALLQKYSSRS